MIDSILAADEIVQVGVPASVLTGVLVWILKDYMSRRKNSRNGGQGQKYTTLEQCQERHKQLTRSLDGVKADVKDLKEGQQDIEINVTKIATIMDERLPGK